MTWQIKDQIRGKIVLWLTCIYLHDPTEAADWEGGGRKSVGGGYSHDSTSGGGSGREDRGGHVLLQITDGDPQLTTFLILII